MLISRLIFAGILQSIKSQVSGIKYDFPVVLLLDTNYFRLTHGYLWVFSPFFSLNMP